MWFPTSARQRFRCGWPDAHRDKGTAVPWEAALVTALTVTWCGLNLALARAQGGETVFRPYTGKLAARLLPPT
jgi:hypothetical protein